MKELIVRGLSGLVFLALVFVPIWLDRLYGWNSFSFVLYFFSFVGTLELSSISGRKKTGFIGAALCTVAFLPVLLNALTEIFSPASAPLFSQESLQWAVYVLLAIWIMLLMTYIALIFSENKVQFMLDQSWFPALFYATLPFLLLALSLAVSERDSRVFLVFILLPIYINDTFAYATGRLLGKRKMFPVVSPKKTWEGFIGGVTGAQIAMHVIVYSVAGFYNGKVAILVTVFSLAASVLATFGDLFESKLKRTAGVKDSGKIIPGHGGVLDRVDAMLFVAPLLYVLLQLILKF